MYTNQFYQHIVEYSIEKEQRRPSLKIRAIILSCLFLLGCFNWFLTWQSETEEASLFTFMDNQHTVLLFHKPAFNHSSTKEWIVDDEQEVEKFLSFLQQYSIQKIAETDIDLDDHIDYFSISLIHKGEDELTIFISEQLISKNKQLYYLIVDDSFNENWLYAFFTYHDKVS